ncbi:MAG: type II secretion system F family protein [Patescibacteria group bacterium]
MKKFTYKARDAKGQLITGEVEASSASYAAKLVNQKKLFVISIKEKSTDLLSLITNFRSRITDSDVSMFTRQVSTMINAGLPITEALSILRTQAKVSVQAVLGQVLADVEGGQSLSSAISKHPQVFNATYVALIRAGETGGVLDKVLARLADDLEKNQEFKGKVKGALIYPVIIIIGMFLVGTIMMIFVIPRLTSLYSEFNATLPLPTQILIGISNVMVKFWPIFLALLVFGIWGFFEYRKTPEGRLQTDALAFKIPIFGELQKEVVLAELSRTMALMVGAGVSILEGLAVTAGVVDNKVISDALKDVSKQIEKGFPIAYSFAQHPEAFPYLLSQMIAVGEETGKMEEVLLKISRIYEVESDQKVKTLTAAIEPIVMVILGVGVGFLVIAIILPIYNLTSQF